MRELGYGEEYRYAHDFEDAIVEQQHLPDNLVKRTYYQPVERGFEREIRKRLEYWAKLRKERGGK